MPDRKKKLAVFFVAFCLSAAALPAGARPPIPTIPPRHTPEPPQPTPAAGAAAPTLAQKAMTLAVGDHVTFGHYEQNGDLARGKEPILWRVLEVSGDEALLLSEYGLDAQPYNTRSSSVTWGGSSLRKWLNEDFLNLAFSEKEKERVLPALIDNGPSAGSPLWTSSGGMNTIDRVFLLSYAEAGKYFKSNEDRAAIPTAYAVQENVYVYDANGACQWWLRSPGMNQNFAMRVAAPGNLSSDGVASKMNAVRPAIWVARKEGITGIHVSPGLTVSGDAQPIGALQGNLSAGDVAAFGHYEQDNDPANGAEAIEWQVLKVEGDRALLLSRYGLDIQPYHAKGGSTSWKNSSLRAWLNGEFEDAAFFSGERKSIPTVTVENGKDENFFTFAGPGRGVTSISESNTRDDVFLLSYADCLRYGTSVESLLLTPYAEAKYSANAGAGDWYWWLRSPGTQKGKAFAVGPQLTDFSVDREGVAVRPALWVNLNAKTLPAAQGKWGSCPWTIDQEGHLTVGAGTGAPFDSSPWREHLTSIASASFEDGVVFPEKCHYLLTDGETYEQSRRGNSKLTSLTFGRVDASGIRDMSAMFSGLSGLTRLDLKNFKAENAGDLSYLFEGCSSLKTLDISGLRTARATALRAMFGGCRALTRLDVSRFETGWARDFSRMFDGCEKLTALSVGKFDTHSARDFSGMFRGCAGLKTLSVKDFNTQNGTDFSSMFSDCKSLTSLDVSGFDTGKAVDLSGMFYGCEKLTKLDVSGFRTEAVKDFSGMFYGCEKLTKLDVSGFRTRRAARMSGMFYGCVRLQELNVVGFSAAANPTLNAMFKGCAALTLTAARGSAFADAARGNVKAVTLQQKTAEVGDILTFGRCEQDNSLANGKEPIEWLVLEKNYTYVTLIALNGLAVRPYHDQATEVNWEKCSLRAWLNRDFLNSAFSEEERAAIQTTTVRNTWDEGYSGWKTWGGPNTRDPIFLLSYAEANRYFQKNADRVCLPSAFAAAQGAIASQATGGAIWWLRSPGSSGLSAAIVNYSGSTTLSRPADTDSVMVRPALRLDTSSRVYQSALL